MTSVALVDDQALVRDELRLILELAGLEVVGEAADGEEGVRLVHEQRPDVVLMDLRMPRMDGIEATRRLVAAGVPTRILVLTTFDGEEHAYQALRAGASGYLLKDIPAERLPDALGAVLDGEATLPRTAVARLLDESTPRRSWSARSNDRRLSDEQKRVLQLVGDGRRTREIARELGIGRDTVRTEVESALRAFRATSADEALTAASWR